MVCVPLGAQTTHAFAKDNMEYLKAEIFMQ